MSIKGFSINGEVQKYDYNALDNLPNVTGLSEEAKTALLACFQNVAWINANGQTYYDALEAALQIAETYTVTNVLTGCTTNNSASIVYEGRSYTATITADSGYTLDGATVSIMMGGSSVTGYYNNGTISIPNVTGNLVITVTATSAVASISAVFTQGSATIYDTDSLDVLKQYLTVVATYADTTTATVNDYTLSGTLTAGTSTIMASYGSKTDTFTVTVTGVTLFDGVYAENTSMYFSNSNTTLVYYKDSTTGNRLTYVLNGTGDHSIPRANTNQTSQTIYPIPIPAGASTLIMQKDNDTQGTMAYVVKWETNKWSKVADGVNVLVYGRNVVDISDINDGSLYVAFTSRNLDNDENIVTDDRTNWTYGWA